MGPKHQTRLANRRETRPLNQWTGQTLQSYKTMGVQYAVIGPKRMFAQGQLAVLPYAFLVGAILPPIL